MSNVIWKFGLEVTDTQILKMPLGAKFLDAQMQNGNLQLWALCNNALVTVAERKIAIYGTGNPMPDDCGEYIATFQMANGSLVFHVFEISI
ncbi:MAG TPA: hypothetical protein PLQ39_08370 [Acinetobacter sp.]|nr:hypothetical protein [Acinetobacter sp.]